ncbi:helix-turn-helix transcriptional regulator [Chryseobacterium sp. RP-3-3]|uniref:Helix-turn-helix transcriptional regulator n=1 Tax=Chryseobacterium antibioticum TaxID=2728847 RepID=A0A7Y0AJ34_9FLAO|nr:helix-turn-helix transcriptional regulator [Chryseobacterium antibioticum]NML68273.1 helix-turn-helix transcriptional regulator [Chryseobacterium antibioticum]
MLTFWGNSIGNVVSLFPLPLVAYVFFQKKHTILYSIYLIVNILTCFLVYQYFDLTFPKYSRSEVIISDVFLFGFNLVVIILLLVYNNKINKLKVLIDVEDKELINSKKENTKTPILQKTAENGVINDETAEKLFKELESMMRNDKMFQKTNLNISMLSTSLNVNYTYLSKIIRCKGYQNFSNYLNVHRINYVKKLIDESNLQKLTLMYIYTEAGFSNQATFNRVFKQIEGITPSEYISQIGKKESEET